MIYSDLILKAEDLLARTDLIREEKLLQLCHLLRDSIDYYDWVGFYFAHPEQQELHLGPYAGDATDHTVIPFGKGICGQVALSNETFLVDDVAAQSNYIACSIDVKSEIVVPLFVGGNNFGQIDIDSNVSAAFGPQDEAFLKQVNARVARLFE